MVKSQSFSGLSKGARAYWIAALWAHRPNLSANQARPSNMVSYDIDRVSLRQCHNLFEIELIYSNQQYREFICFCSSSTITADMGYHQFLTLFRIAFIQWVCPVISPDLSIFEFH